MHKYQTIIRPLTEKSFFKSLIWYQFDALAQLIKEIWVVYIIKYTTLKFPKFFIYFITVKRMQIPGPEAIRTQIKPFMQKK